MLDFFFWGVEYLDNGGRGCVEVFCGLVRREEGEDFVFIDIFWVGILIE